MRKILIETRNKELFRKLNYLKFIDEIVVDKDKGVSRIVNNINKREKLIEAESFGGKTLLKRLKPLNLNIKMR